MDSAITGWVGTLRAHRPELRPVEIWNKGLDGELARMPENAFDGRGEAAEYARLVRSGLHLWNESLDASHTISQEIGNETGSYWHGIMHRMEGDYGNAKYWFRRVGTHPVFIQLRSSLEEGLGEGLTGPDAHHLRQLAAQPGWNPYLFVDAVEACCRSGKDETVRQRLIDIQQREIILLLEYCLERFGGGTLRGLFN